MITALLVKLLVTLLVGMTALLPTYKPPAAADLGAFQFVSWLIPVNEIVTLCSMLAAYALASITYVAVNWVINKARGSG